MSHEFKIKKSDVKFLINEIPFAYLIFRFYVLSIPSSVQKLALLTVVLMYIYTNTRHLYMNKNHANSLCMFGLIFLFALITPVLHGTNDFTYVNKLISCMLDIICWDAFFVHIIKKSDKNATPFSRELAKSLGYIVLLYILFTLLCIASSSLKTLWQQVVYFSEKEQMMLMYSKYSGRIGWNGFAGFNATLVCSILVLFGIINFDSEFKITRKVHFSTLTPILIGVIGNFFYGRTGLLVSFMMIFVYCFMVILKYSSVKLLMYFFAIFMLLFIIVVVLKNRIHALESIYNWVFEIFINYSEGNGLEASSLTTLKAMYILPNLKTFLLGDGYYTNAVTGFYYMNIDVGILRLLYFWGAIPTIILYIFSLKGFRNTFCDRYLFILPILLLVLFELKGEACRLLLCISVALQFYNKEIIHRNKGMRTRS